MIKLKRNRNTAFSLSKWVKKVKKERALVRLIVICLVLLIACIFLSAFHVNRIFSTYEQSTNDNIVNRSDLTSKYFSDNFERRGSLVAAEAQVLAQDEDIDKASICNCLKVLEETGEFSYAFYVNSRNKYRSNGTLSSAVFTDYSNVIDSTDSITIFRNFAPEITNDEVCFASTVQKNGVIQGYIIGVAQASQLFEAMTSTSTSMVTERYLTDSHGDIVAYVKNDNIYDGTGKNIFDLLTRDSIDDFAAEQVRDEVLNEINQEKITTRDISVDGRKAYALYKQLVGSNGWDLFYIVYSDDVRTSIQGILVESFATMITVIIIMAIMAFCVSHYIEGEQKKVFDLAYVDELTRAPNENAFKERASELLMENPEVPYMLTCFDVVNFRYINEGYGHLKADMLLRDIAVALRESYSYNETFGRLSADRFVGLCVDDERTAERKEFINDRLVKATEEIGMKYPIKFKTGIYYIRDKKEAIADMIDKANLARKSISAGVRNNYEAEYREQLMEETRKQERVESRMHEALKKNEFKPYLQPKWNMATDQISGAEALIRWVDSTGHIIPPNEFIPVFERNGFIENVDFFMLEEICKYIRRMIDEGREVYPVSINQSRYLLYDPNYIMKVQEIMLKYKVPKGLIELEITETVFFNEKERMLDVMRNLKEFNMNLSIDDFGSGYSSLNLLRDIPFDVLKIDRGFLDESAQSESGKWILRKIVEMADGLNLKVICEGVETHEQVEMLLDIGCVFAQGFLYSRPIPLDDFIEKYNIPLDEDSPVTYTDNES